MNIERRLAAMEAAIAKKKSPEALSPELARVIAEIINSVREAALNPKPGMEDVCRAYAAVLLPLHGETVPDYAEGWLPKERYWREVARCIENTCLVNAAEPNRAIAPVLDDRTRAVPADEIRKT